MTLGKMPTDKPSAGDYVVWEGGMREHDSPSSVYRVAYGTPGIVDWDDGVGSTKVVFADYRASIPLTLWCRTTDLRVIDEREYLTRVAAAALIPEIGQ